MVVWYGTIPYHTIRYYTIPTSYYLPYIPMVRYLTDVLLCCVQSRLRHNTKDHPDITYKRQPGYYIQDNPDITYKRQPGYPLGFPPSAGNRTINDTIPIANGKRRPTTHTAKNFKYHQRSLASHCFYIYTQSFRYPRAIIDWM